MRQTRPTLTRGQAWLLAVTVLCYAVGYPLGIVLDSAVGWVLVSLGGLGLLALGVVTVRRIHRT